MLTIQESKFSTMYDRAMETRALQLQFPSMRIESIRETLPVAMRAP